MPSVVKEIYQTYTLSNGLRLVHRYTSSQVAHCAITINVGSRDERVQENGMAHFIEHCIFKGTKTKSNRRILSLVDATGGELNAFTTKEETCIYATFMVPYYERVLDLFSDIVFNSVFPEIEIEKEKSVIIDEINSYQDSPSEQIFDDFELLLYGRTGLGRYILGSEDRVQCFTSAQLKDFIAQNYATDKMVLSTIGNIDFEKWVRLCEKFFSSFAKNETKNHRTQTKKYSVQTKVYHKDTNQAHLAIGNRAYSYKNDKRVPFTLLNNILGGGAMNSRLNMHIREKYGLTYALESSYTAYSDTGVFMVYASMDFEQTQKTIKLIINELASFADKLLTPLALKQAKEQFIGQMAIQYENNQNEVISMGKSLLNYGKIDTLAQMNQEINSLSSLQLQEVANEVFNNKQYSQITYLS